MEEVYRRLILRFRAGHATRLREMIELDARRERVNAVVAAARRLNSLFKAFFSHHFRNARCLVPG